MGIQRVYTDFKVHGKEVGHRCRAAASSALPAVLKAQSIEYAEGQDIQPGAFLFLGRFALSIDNFLTA